MGSTVPTPVTMQPNGNTLRGTDESDEKSQEFLEMLVSQRRGLFFKIPKESEAELHLWELTVFKFAGEYLDSLGS